MSSKGASCTREASSVSAPETTESPAQELEPVKEVSKMGVTVGQKAPDFTAPAFYKGDFSSVTLSDITAKGKWVLLCFYPGDFTFV